MRLSYIVLFLMKKFLSFLLFFFTPLLIDAQSSKTVKAELWADSVFNSLNDDQRIAQLMIIRESTFSQQGPVYHDSLIRALILQYNIGGICLFQGTPLTQATFINEFQALARTPLMVCIDGEWGLGMRFDSVLPLRHPMMLGAAGDPNLAYDYGSVVGRQMKRMGIQVDYAPVVDINNNPANPVINDRSFGENKYTVADLGLAYALGLQNEGIMACAKHFPGHGDVAVDSHLDLPVINKTIGQLDTLELYPFKKLIEGGVAAVMIGHLFVPAIDTTPNTATSISKNAVTGLLRNKLHFEGLTFTDALGMQGVAKYFPGGRIAAQSLIAGNDMLCLPESVPDAISAVREAIDSGRLSWHDVYEKCRKVLRYKYLYGSAEVTPVNTFNLTGDLNEGIDALNERIAAKAITLLRNRDATFFPLKKSPDKTIAYVGIGTDSANVFAGRMASDFGADNFFVGYGQDSQHLSGVLAQIRARYTKVVIGIHNYKRFPANQYGITGEAISLVNEISALKPTIVLAFGNPYALQYFCDASNLVACYEDDSVTQVTAAKMLRGDIPFLGRLPVTVCENLKSGAGVITAENLMPVGRPEAVGMNGVRLRDIDSIVGNGIAARAFPGAVVLAARNGKIFYQKAFGTYNYGEARKITTETIFDLASLTKIVATNLSVMRLYDQGKIKLHKTLGDYLPWVRGSDKESLTIKNILLHQAGLKAFIPFFRDLIDEQSGEPLPQYFRNYRTDSFAIRVAQELYLRTDWEDSIYRKILDSKLSRPNRYIYSDIDFIFLGKVVEAVSGEPLDVYAAKNFYNPMRLQSTGFRPREKFDTNLIAPTEFERHFRMQHLHGDVHDPGAALFGGVSGHAGLFSDAGDLAALLQMLDNGGTFKGKRYLNASTIKLFTAYNSAVSRRGLGFDKPQKDHYTTRQKRPYPSRYASALTYGHTGYTGTAVWVDPKYNLIYVFLSNRVNPDGGENLKISTMNIRGAIEDTLYKAMIPVPSEVQKKEVK